MFLPFVMCPVQSYICVHAVFQFPISIIVHYMYIYAMYHFD